LFFTNFVDEKFVADQIQAEEKRVKEIEKNITGDETNRILAETAQLKLRQDEKQGIDVLRMVVFYFYAIVFII
jgi:Zn-dependent M16 (insulinase) family peptidase